MADGGSFDTFPKLLLRNAAQFGSRPAFRHKDLGIWQTWTWIQVTEIVRAYAAGLQRLGLQLGDTIAIVGSNRFRSPIGPEKFDSRLSRGKRGKSGASQEYCSTK